MKKYVVISGFNVHSANRGNAALAYGTIGFLECKGLLQEGQEIVRFELYTNPFRKGKRFITEEVLINGKKWKYHRIPLCRLEQIIIKFGLILPFTRVGKVVRNIEYEASDYGGDGFSDIYGDKAFLSRMSQTFLLWKAKVPLFMLPQTIGPFSKATNRLIAEKVLRHAAKIYVRDDNYINELKTLHVNYERAKDLSSYMHPEKWNVEIIPKSIGLNVSGLAYSNNYHGLEGHFENYPLLINRIIEYFQDKGHHVYLIPHSYNYNNPVPYNDDMIACREIYQNALNKNGLHLVDKDLTSPQVKYLISQMFLFIGTRMHANFAAIYTNTPVFGLAYSYKFKGGFDANGLDGDKQTALIKDMNAEQVEMVLNKITLYYNQIYC